MNPGLPQTHCDYFQLRICEADVPADPSQVWEEGAVSQRRRVQGGLEQIQLRLFEGKLAIYRVTHHIVPNLPWHQNKSCILVWGPCTKTQLLFWCQREVGNTLNHRRLLRIFDLCALNIGHTEQCILSHLESAVATIGFLRSPVCLGNSEITIDITNPLFAKLDRNHMLITPNKKNCVVN